MSGKVAWICKGYYGEPDDDYDDWQILFEEPSIYKYKKVKRIVFFEIEE